MLSVFGNSAKRSGYKGGQSFYAESIYVMTDIEFQSLCSLQQTLLKAFVLRLIDTVVYFSRKKKTNINASDGISVDFVVR